MVMADLPLSLDVALQRDTRPRVYNLMRLGQGDDVEKIIFLGKMSAGICNTTTLNIFDMS